MHCPRCGQQQISAETKFCSRCGFPMATVSELLYNGGYLPQPAPMPEKEKLPSRKTGLKIGLSWFLVLTLLLTPLFNVFDADELAGLCAVLGTIGGILIMFFSFMFLEKTVNMPSHQTLPAPDAHTPQYLGGQNRQTVLPPQRSQPVESYIPPAENWRAPNTGELARPGSVTENTTKLLNKDE